MAPRKKEHERSIFECVIIIKIKIKIKVKTVSNWENLKAKKKERKSTVSVAISSWERLTYCLYITSFLPFLNRWVTCGKIKHLMALKMARQPLFFILYYFIFFSVSKITFCSLSLSPISPLTKHRNLPEMKSHKHKTNRSSGLSGGDSPWPLLVNNALKWQQWVDRWSENSGGTW